MYIAPRRESSALHAIRHAQGRPESEQLRPIYRKGFPGKKSAKAEVFLFNFSLIIINDFDT